MKSQRHLPYRICYCSSETAENPAAELELACLQADAVGGNSYTISNELVCSESADFPDSPVEIGIYLGKAVYIESVTLLLHELFVPCAAEIFIGSVAFYPQHDSSLERAYFRCQFNALGKTSFLDKSDNPNGEKFRESKIIKINRAVGLQSHASFAKILFHRAYTHPRNPQLKVALRRLQVRGSVKHFSTSVSSVSNVDTILQDLGLLDASEKQIHREINLRNLQSHDSFDWSAQAPALIQKIQSHVESAIRGELFSLAEKIAHLRTNIVDIDFIYHVIYNIGTLLH